MYDTLAEWFHLLTPPAEYDGEAAPLYDRLARWTHGPLGTALELGSGGGNLACHLKEDLTLTLVDLSPRMLALSRNINPDVEHIEGDMRTVALDRHFDAVFVHDAICYATNRVDLKATIARCAEHCRPGGTVALMPDYTAETFEVDTDCGGSDGEDGRSLRYLEWTRDKDPDDEQYEVSYTYLVDRGDGDLEVLTEVHVEGCFARKVWLDTLRAEGLVPFRWHDPWERDVFLGLKPQHTLERVGAEDIEALEAYLQAGSWPFHGPGQSDRDKLTRQWTREGVEGFWIRDLSGEVLGVARLWDLDDPTALLDFRLGEEHRGQGLGRRILRHLTDHIFARHDGLQRIEGYTRSINVGMQKAFASAGYRREGIHRGAWSLPDGLWDDAWDFAITRGDWLDGSPEIVDSGAFEAEKE